MKLAYHIQEVRGHTLIITGEKRPIRGNRLTIVAPPGEDEPKLRNPNLLVNNHWVVTKVYDLAPGRWVVMLRPVRMEELGLVEYEDERVFRDLDRIAKHGFG